MSEPDPPANGHASEIKETAASRRGSALREAGRNEEVISEGSVKGNGGVDEREGTRRPRQHKTKKSPRAKGLTYANSVVSCFVRAVGDIAGGWFRHDHSRSAAALAFYSIFSLVPLLVILTKLAGTIVGAEAAREEIGSASAMFLDDNSTGYLLELVEQQSSPGWTGWMSLIALGVLLFTASKVVVELREVLSLIFGVRRRREGRRGWVVDLLVKRGVPILLILSLGFVIAISAVLGTLFHYYTDRYYSGYSDLAVWKGIEQVASLATLALIFTFVLRWLPPTPPCFRAALGGAVVASLLLAGLRNLMSLYFDNAGVTSVYGAAVTLVVVLLWIYFSVQIFFIGAEVAGFLNRKWSTAAAEEVGAG